MKISRSPVIITQNGKPTAVLLTPEEFDALQEKFSVISAVKEGLADVKAGRVFSEKEIDKELDEEFGPLPRGRK
jgi:PHD/YefM family antitoxin component YafN of YafNO toxin-antitoxin module